jgi:hypothetical protein
MSKVEELRSKYSNLTAATFTKFVDGDKTPTKKYLEFMLRTWTNRNENFCPSTVASLISLVKNFDELLPYIENKDIYSKDYYDVSILKLVIVRAQEIKEEKTFVKEEHVLILDDTEEYILVQPLSHRGSLRYGAQTRWCTAAKKEVSTFARYTKSGLLVYFSKSYNVKDWVINDIDVISTSSYSTLINGNEYVKGNILSTGHNLGKLLLTSINDADYSPPASLLINGYFKNSSSLSNNRLFIIRTSRNNYIK